jgi:enoyl-CoA hydratase
VKFDCMRAESLEGILTVSIDHPGSPLNAVDAALHADLDRLFESLRRDDEHRCVVLTGRPGAFSAGGDYRWFPWLQDPVAREEVRRAGRRIIWNLLDLEIPIVAAVGGPAIGLGATLALCCDALFMADDAVLGDPHVKVGLVAGDGGTAIWPALVGPMLAKRFLLTGDTMDADTAHALGLVSHVVAPEELMEEVRSFARRLAAGAPLAIRYTKSAINGALKQRFAEAFDVAVAYETVTMTSADHVEAVAAAVEKREPRFEGR